MIVPVRLLPANLHPRPPEPTMSVKRASASALAFTIPVPPPPPPPIVKHLVCIGLGNAPYPDTKHSYVRCLSGAREEGERARAHQFPSFRPFVPSPCPVGSLGGTGLVTSSWRV